MELLEAIFGPCCSPEKEKPAEVPVSAAPRPAPVVEAPLAAAAAPVASRPLAPGPAPQQTEQEPDYDTKGSTLGPLPTFEKPQGGAHSDSDAMSEGGHSVASHHLPPPSDSVPDKEEIKRFVKELVKGSKYTVVSTAGDYRTCTVTISKKLDKLRIQAGADARKIPLVTVGNIYTGTEPSDIDTPLDALCSTLALTTGECITFRFKDVRTRDTFAMCIQLFSENQR